MELLLLSYISDTIDSNIKFTFQYGATVTNALNRLNDLVFGFTFQYGATVTR